MRRHYSFSVPFVKGWHRQRARKVGRGIQFFPCAQDRDNKDAIADAFWAAARRQHPGLDPVAPKGTPVRVAICTERGVLSAFPKRDGDSHPDVQKPDADNDAKLVLDALNGLAWEDDQQVNDLHVIKRDRTRGTEPRTLVNIEWEDRK